MSISASIDVKINNKTECPIINIIKSFINGGWRVKDDDNKITYLPLGDNGDFDWQHEMISMNELMDIIEKKESAAELIGISMYWKETNIGVELLSRSSVELSFSLDINRKRIQESNIMSITDANWYIERTVSILKHQGHYVESFIFEEYQ